MLVLLALHLVLALAAPLLARPLGRHVLLVVALAPAATAVWLASRASEVLGGGTVTERLTWLPSLGVALDVRLDAFSMLMAGLVSGIGVLVFVYAWAYMGNKPGIGRFAAPLVAFAGAMLGLVLADNLLLLFVFWELTSITSFMLIGFEDQRERARKAATQALVITGGGGLALLAGLVLLAQAAGTWSLMELVADPPTGGVVPWALVLVLLGAFTKSAQVPFHGWLPGAMAAPTPVSAYLHSATMVKAGVYLIAVLAPAFASEAPWRALVLTFGLATFLWGAYQALRQYDLKLLLAFGTVSTLGLLVALYGVGTAKATFAATALLLAHAFYKAALFTIAGTVDKATGTRDLRQLHGVGRRLPVLAAAAAVAVASMAGLPPLLGYTAKEAGIEAALLLDAPLAVIVAGAFALGSVLTVAYGARLFRGTFIGTGSHPVGEAASSTPRAPDGSPPAPTPLRTRPGPVLLLVPALLLGVLTVALGVLPAVANRLVVPAAAALNPDADVYELLLWPGFTPALGISALVIVAGVLLALSAASTERLQARLAAGPDAQTAFNRAYDALLRGAATVTAVVQSGSLPVYLVVCLVTLLVLPGGALLAAAAIPDDLVLADNAWQLVAATVAAAAVAGAVTVRRRFAAVVLVSTSGLAVGAVFVTRGAPDLALTQFLVETVLVIAFVLVMRRLPEHFQPSPDRLRHVGRIGLALAAGVYVTVLSLSAYAARQPGPTTGDQLVALAPDAGGRNVVNVILTDFRAMDTLGEITVIAVAALGVLRLVQAVRHRDEHPVVAPAPMPGTPPDQPLSGMSDVSHPGRQESGRQESGRQESGRQESGRQESGGSGSDQTTSNQSRGARS